MNQLKWMTGLLGLMIIVSLSSCYYDKEDRLYGNTSNSCDSMAAVSYTQHVVPLLQQYCYSCHLGSSPSGGIEMGTYATDKAIALNGQLYGTISYASGFSPMPDGEPKLADCQINIIKRWVDDGAPNN